MLRPSRERSVTARRDLDFEMHLMARLEHRSILHPTPNPKP